MENTLTFRTETQVALFNHEIIGQLSDGKWENTRPSNHWQVWGRATVQHAKNDRTPIGRNFKADKCNYDLVAFAQENDCCHDRMLRYIRITKVFGFSFLSTIKGSLDLDGQAILPTHEGPFWDDRRNKLSGFNLERIQEVTEDSSIYSKKDLMTDLKEMQQAMRSDIFLVEKMAKLQEIKASCE